MKTGRPPQRTQSTPRGTPGICRRAACAAPPLAPPAAPEPVAIDSWLTAVVDDAAVQRPGGDPVIDALVAGTFVPPAEGAEWPAAVPWTRVPGGANGEVQRGEFAGRLYAVGTFAAAAESGALVRADGAIRVYVNGVPQPGDPYASGRHRIPARLRAGDNVFVAVAAWREGNPSVQVEAVAGEVAFNTGDVTFPDLLVGSDEELPLGVALLNLTDRPLFDVRARVVGDEHFRATTSTTPALAPLAVTQVGFRIQPRRKPSAAGETWPANLRIESPSLGNSYACAIDLHTVARDSVYRRTFLSGVDLSTQYYGVVPPSGGRGPFALVLSLHGAGVEAIGQAGSYSRRDWCCVVAPTNRRPFGFDWEDWGRLDAMEALEDARSAFSIDESRVYLTGHSMGGHGTWHVGAIHADRFAAIAPSAGWASFESYAGARTPSGEGVAEALHRAAAASDTFDYLENLAGRGVYILHGGADDNVPVEQGRTMNERVRAVTDDVVYHEQPGAGHWWDGPDAPGVDCVDWIPLFEFLRGHRRDELPNSFRMRFPSPWVNPAPYGIGIAAEEDPYEDCEIEGRREGDALILTTRNVRALSVFDLRRLAREVRRIVVDSREIPEDEFLTGAAAKVPGVHGPLKEVFCLPFAFVYPDDAEPYRRYASYLVSLWNIRGNGHAFAVPLSRAGTARRAYNLIYVGVPFERVPVPASTQLRWDAAAISLGDRRYEGCAAAAVFPDGESGRLAAWIGATAGNEGLLYEFGPFVSGVGFPDYVIWDSAVRSGGWGAARCAGFFDADWRFEPRFRRP